jgi:hypothetical protein
MFAIDALTVAVLIDGSGAFLARNPMAGPHSLDLFVRSDAITPPIYADQPGQTALTVDSRRCPRSEYRQA